jgi:hypothetical protein
MRVLMRSRVGKEISHSLAMSRVDAQAIPLPAGKLFWGGPAGPSNAKAQPGWGKNERELEGTEECDQVLLLCRSESVECGYDRISFRADLACSAWTGMQSNRSHKVAGAAVVQEEYPLANAPERRRAELVRTGLTLAYAVRQPCAHVMQSEV